VVSAIGHEGDRPLCDEVADLRCGTPSLAAHAVVPDRALLHGQLAEQLERAGRELDRKCGACRDRVKHAEVAGALASGLPRAQARLGLVRERMSWCHPQGRVRAGRQRLGGCDWHRPFSAVVASGHQRLSAAHRHAQSLSPQRALERGFAVVKRSDGTVVRSPAQVAAGDPLTLLVAGGAIAATVSGRPGVG
jgi:exodeoxyribonuclease VII large subunit